MLRYITWMLMLFPFFSQQILVAENPNSQVTLAKFDSEKKPEQNQDKLPNYRSEGISFTPTRSTTEIHLHVFLSTKGVLGICIDQWLERSYQQREIVKWIESVGGEVKYGDKFKNYKDSKAFQPYRSKTMVWKYFPRPAVFKSWIPRDFEWNVRWVRFDRPIQTVAPLTGLSKLECLSFMTNGSLSDFSSIRNLQSLERLDLSSGTIDDLSPIVELEKLTWLAFGSVKGDLSLKPISQLHKLEFISFGRLNNIDYSVLDPLQNITHLRLGYKDEVNDLSFLAKHSNLENLRFGVTNTKDFSPISKLKKLKSIQFSETCDTSDCLFLSELQELEHLSFENGTNEGFRAISNLKNLKRLGFGKDCILSDCEFLSKLDNLETIYFSRAKVRSISGIEELKNLDVILDCNKKKTGDVVVYFK